MLIHHLLPSPRHSHTSSISSFWVGKLGRAKRGGTRARPEHEDGDEERLARARETERERESDGVLGRARQLRLPTMAAQGGLQLRVSSRPSKNDKTRERRSVTERYALRSSAPTREDKERNRKRLIDRPTDLPLLAQRADLFFFSLRLAARVR